MHLTATTTQPHFTSVDYTWGGAAILAMAAIIALTIVGSYKVGKTEPAIHPRRYLYGGLGFCMLYGIIVFGFLYHQDTVESVDKGINQWAKEVYGISLTSQQVADMTLGYTNHILYNAEHSKMRETFDSTMVVINGKETHIQLVYEDEGFQLMEITRKGEFIAPLESGEDFPSIQ